MARTKSLSIYFQATSNSACKKDLRSLLLANRRLRDVAAHIVARDYNWYAADVQDLESMINPLHDDALLVSLQQIRKLFVILPSSFRIEFSGQAREDFDNARSVGRALRRMPNLETCIVMEEGTFPDGERLRQQRNSGAPVSSRYKKLVVWFGMRENVEMIEYEMSGMGDRISTDLRMQMWESMCIWKDAHRHLFKN